MISKILVGATALLAVAVSVVNGACDNGCSGHGTCGADDVCKCYSNWRMGDEDSGDCSDRVCPFELAWVDVPDTHGSFHKYAECAGRGICNRGSGECECFEGYEGKGCQRTTCPNDCSGHGTCEYIEELGFGAAHGSYFTGATGYKSFGNNRVTFSNAAWDDHKTMGCFCDAKWTDVDCSRRMCPKGNDVLNTRLDTSDTLIYQVQQIHIPYNTWDATNDFNEFKANAVGTASEDTSKGVVGGFLALTFTSTLNETFTTKPIKLLPVAADTNVGTPVVGTGAANSYQDTDATDGANAIGTMIENALKALPHKVIDDVTVTTTEGAVPGDGVAAGYLDIFVTFTGAAVQGTQNLLQVEELACDNGCYPFLPKGASQSETTSSDGKITVGGSVIQTATQGSLMPYVTQSGAADYNNYECGRRGKCDYGSGLCECFDGYTGESCSIQTALL